MITFDRVRAGRRAVVGIATCIVVCGALAQEAAQPKVREGDKWVYIVKTEGPTVPSATRKWEATVVRASTGSMVIASKPTDSNLPAREAMLAPDWTRSASVNGKLITTIKDFDFPLQIGKKWEVAFENERPNDRVKLTKNMKRYTVVAWEEVKVPAGTFKALKIEADGEWFNDFEASPTVSSTVSQSGPSGSATGSVNRNPMQRGPATGKLYKAVWYVPEIKREVKMIDESFGADGTMGSRTTAELESHSVQP